MNRRKEAILIFITGLVIIFAVTFGLLIIPTVILSFIFDIPITLIVLIIFSAGIALVLNLMFHINLYLKGEL